VISTLYLCATLAFLCVPYIHIKQSVSLQAIGVSVTIVDWILKTTFTTTTSVSSRSYPVSSTEHVIITVSQYFSHLSSLSCSFIRIMSPQRIIFKMKVIMTLGSVFTTLLPSLALFAGLASSQEAPLVSTNYCFHSIDQNMIHVILDVVSVAAINPYQSVSARLGPM
jgi:hypothetical protein